jgi:hypothetical protein
MYVKRLPVIKLLNLSRTIVCTLLNKFDCFTVVCGNTGLGKSTCALHLARYVRLEFKKLKELKPEVVKYYYERVMKNKGVPLEEFVAYLIELRDKNRYTFALGRDVIYTQETMKKILSSYQRIGIADEMVNITFNRDFTSLGNKDIIKMINMYRDHNNLIIACIPNFIVLDNQIKNLVKLRLDVVRRGVAVIQTPNKVIYGRDKWDTALNEKIEREWISKKTKNPSYAKLTTCRGIMRFPPLKPSYEAKYKGIKDRKRNIIKERMGVDSDGDSNEIDSFTILLTKLMNKAVKNGETLKGFAMANNISEESLKRKLRKELEKKHLSTTINAYYTDKKAREKEEGVW